MKLTDLDPRWWAEPGRQGQGVVFRCPCCREMWICVAFANPVDGGAPWVLHPSPRSLWDVLYQDVIPRGQPVVPPGALWLRAGETFEDLGLLPSVDASRAGHWHGYLQNGACQ